MKNLIVILSIFCCTSVFAQKKQSYVRISYSSICCGTPSTNPVMTYVNQFQKKNKTKAFEIVRQSGLGREGEFDLYINTDQLSKTKKTKFITGLQSAIALQNKNRNENSDGFVNFDESKMFLKPDVRKTERVLIQKN